MHKSELIFQSPPRGKALFLPRGYNPSSSTALSKEAVFVIPIAVMNHIHIPIVTIRESGSEMKNDTRNGIVGAVGSNTADVIISMLSTICGVMSPVKGNLQQPYITMLSRGKENDESTEAKKLLQRSPTKTVNPSASGFFDSDSDSDNAGTKKAPVKTGKAGWESPIRWGDARAFKDPRKSY